MYMHVVSAGPWFVTSAVTMRSGGNVVVNVEGGTLNTSGTCSPSDFNFGAMLGADSSCTVTGPNQLTLQNVYGEFMALNWYIDCHWLSFSQEYVYRYQSFRLHCNYWFILSRQLDVQHARSLILNAMVHQDWMHVIQIIMNNKRLHVTPSTYWYAFLVYCCSTWVDD